MRNYIFYGTLIVSLCFFNVSLTAKDILGGTKVENFNITDPIFQEISGSKVDVIIIDPGHGGYDSGTSGLHNTKEKDINLRIALFVGKSIQEHFPALTIIYTRKTDVFIPLSERAKIANDAKADLFISIHCNAMPLSAAGAKIHGSETYVLGATKKEHNLSVAKRENETILMDPNHASYQFMDADSPEWHIFMSMYQQNYLERSIQFADLVEKKFAAYNKRKSRGVVQNNFHVLREVAMPSVLIETGYLSNFSDEKYLKSKEGQMKIVQAISDAFYEYKTGIEANAPVYINIAPTHIADSKLDTSNDFASEAPSILAETSTAAASNQGPITTAKHKLKKDKKQTATKVRLAENTFPKPQIKRKKKKVTQQLVIPKPIIKRYFPAPRAEKVTASIEQNTFEDIKPVQNVNKSKIIVMSSGQKDSEGPSPKPIKRSRKKKKLVDINSLEMTPVFKIQLAASKSPLNVKSKKYNQLSNIEVVYEAGYFKYLTGHTKHWSDITSVFKVLKNKGFKGFIVAYLNGHRIGLEEARNMAGK